MLLPARQQNINIVLGRLKMDPGDIVQALIVYDEKLLNLNMCEMLLPIIPTESEISQVYAFDGDLETLSTADKFVLLFASAPGYDLRINAILFKLNYRDEAVDILKKIEAFYNSFEFVLSNKAFHTWLELFLAFGNYLNGTTNRGGAYGYKLDTLVKVNEFKTNDNKKTLLYYVMEFVGDTLKNDELFNIKSEIEEITKCKYLVIINL